MPMIIDGKKIPMDQLKGTDAHCVHQFLNAVKGKAAIMVYVEADGEISVSSVWKTKGAAQALEERILLRVYDEM